MVTNFLVNRPISFNQRRQEKRDSSAEATFRYYIAVCDLFVVVFCRAAIRLRLLLANERRLVGACTKSHARAPFCLDVGRSGAGSLQLAVVIRQAR